jgi:hypothetical protein
MVSANDLPPSETVVALHWRAAAIAAHLPLLLAWRAGGTNCRFQVWQLDKHFRPSRMVLEQVGWRSVLKPVFALMHCSLPVQSCGLPVRSFTPQPTTKSLVMH